MPTIAHHVAPEKKSTAKVPDPSSLDDLKALVDGGGDNDDIQVDVQPEPSGDDVVVNTGGDDDVVIEDDTPEEDRGRDVAGRDTDYDEEDKSIEAELKQINAPNLQKRIRQLTKRSHDERRAKEAESRRADEATNYARAIFQHNQKIAKQLEDLGKTSVAASQESASAKVAKAQQDYKDALEAGDAEAIAKANYELQQAVIQEAMAKGARAPVADAPPQPPNLQKIQPKTADWIQRNGEWFQKDPILTNAALGFHNIAVTKKGLTPETDAYYTFIDENMKPLLSANGLAPEPSTGKTNTPKKKAVDTVTPVSRSTGAAPKQNSAPTNKVTLSATEAAMARELMPDIPVREAYMRYAKQKLASAAAA